MQPIQVYTKPKNIINVWKLDVILSTGSHEPELIIFNVMTDALTDVTAQQRHVMTKTKTQPVIDISVDSALNIHLSLEKTEYATDKFWL